jgi:Raf kinase inhibitor-like YbhB/YbcL family protein
MKLTSPVFTDNGELPAKYSCEGEGMSPPLSIEEVIPLAKSLALTVDDPDAPNGTFHHWLVWNIDPKTKDISENSLPNGAVVGTNSAGDMTFAAACPPAGTHR